MSRHALFSRGNYLSNWRHFSMTIFRPCQICSKTYSHSRVGRFCCNGQRGCWGDRWRCGWWSAAARRRGPRRRRPRPRPLLLPDRWGRGFRGGFSGPRWVAMVRIVERRVAVCWWWDYAVSVWSRCSCVWPAFRGRSARDRGWFVKWLNGCGIINWLIT